MGYQSALSMAGAADEMGLELETVLSWHLTSNHYPPVPTSMIGPCKEAIEAFGDEDYDRLINLPDGISWRDQTQVPASVIVEGHHLEAFLD